MRSDLRRVDPLDVATGCALLSALPQNWPHLQRLDALAKHALTNEARDKPRRLEHGRWRRWLRDSPTLASGHGWDPPESPLTAPILFFGGDYVLPTGGEPDTAFSLQHVLDVLVFSKWPRDARAMRAKAFALAGAVLKLGDRVSAAVGTGRYAVAGPRSDLVDIPTAARMSAMAAGFSYTEEELENLIAEDSSILAPLEHDLGEALLPELATPEDAFDRTPIIRRGDRHVVAGPLSLGVGLRHALMCLVVEHGYVEQFAGFSAKRSLAHLSEAAQRMDWDLLQVLPVDESPLRSAIFEFDTDKVAHVALVCDDLAGYDPADARGNWQPKGALEALTARIEEVELGLTMGPPPRTNELLHVVVLAGVGRLFVFGLPEFPSPTGSQQLLFTAEAFGQVSMLGPDRLELWKFAKAGDRLRQHAQVMSFNPLDEYALWRDNSNSFYLGDDGRPTMVLVDASYGRALREEVAATTDVHALPTPRGTSEVVVRLHGSGDIPIYGALFDLGGRPRMATVTERHVVWTQGEDESSGTAHRSAAAAMVDCIAYWFWQIGPSLPELACLGCKPLVVNVLIEDPDSWDEFATPEPTGDAVSAEVTGQEITVTVHSAMPARLDGPVNDGEREIVKEILRAVAQLDGSAMHEDELQAVVDRHAPRGPKKKLNFFHAGRTPALRPGPLPRARLRQDADSSEALDEMADLLLPELDKPVGPVPEDERSAVLNAAVDVHYRLMTAVVATLSPDGLLEELMARHEALLRRGVLQRRQLGSRIACFEETKLVQDLIDEVPEVTSTSIALRFLIEYVAAVPPQGFRPLSLAVYDYLIAHAAEIVNRGMASDVIRNRLDDIQVSVLASGRLGMDQETRYRSGQSAFLAASMPVMAQLMADSYAMHWEESTPERPDFADDLDAASRAEFGFTQMEFGDMVVELVNAAERRDARAVAAEERDVLAAELASELNWSPDRVAEMFQLLTLGPRADFLKPPAPFKGSDVYPWQFNRALSYLRRPLVVRGSEVLWGMRHVYEAGRFLLNLILSERLHASSREMKQFMSKIRQRETEAFNQRIGELCNEHGLVVRLKVDRVGELMLAREDAGRDGEQIGDIDVLAADPAHRILYLLECKDLEGARTPVELKNEINSTFRVGGSKRSKLEIHLERIAWIERHLEQTLAWLKMEGPASTWTVEGRMITDIEVLAPHVLGSSPIPIQSAAALAEELRGAIR